MVNVIPNNTYLLQYVKYSLMYASFLTTGYDMSRCLWILTHYHRSWQSSRNSTEWAASIKSPRLSAKATQQ